MDKKPINITVDQSGSMGKPEECPPLYIQVYGRANRIGNAARWHKVDTTVSLPNKVDCELTPNVELYFTGETPVVTGVPDDGEPALMARLMEFVVRKRLR